MASIPTASLDAIPSTAKGEDETALDQSAAADQEVQESMNVGMDVKERQRSHMLGTRVRGYGCL